MKFFMFLVLICLTILVFNNWIFNPIMSSGDFNMLNNTIMPIYAWGYDTNGIGSQVFNFSWTVVSKNILLFIPSFLLKLDPLLSQRISYFYFFIFLSIFSSIILYKRIFKDNMFYFLSPLIFLFNTYILLLMGGGQVFVALSYTFSALVLLVFINLINTNLLKHSLIFGLILSFQIIIDIRIAYISLVAVLIYFIIKQIQTKSIKYSFKTSMYVFVLPAVVSILINAFWILPTILGRKNPIQELGSAYSSLEAVKFFSFAKLEDAMSLLHPNWPENIFGKTAFLKPEFLILPILAFASLLFIKTLAKEKRINIIFFALLGLLGIFLAKGANEPFGGVYLWLFDNLPGFIMFRDPTKWYTLIALSYSILIPFTIWNIFEYLKKYKKVRYIPQIFLVIVIAYLLFLIRPALLGQLSGTFKSIQIPNEYVKLEKFISSNNNFSRTLWIPTIQRFGYYSNSHPAIPAQNLFKTVENSEIIKKMETRETELFLQEAAVKYVIIPNDSQGEIFLKDRKYNEGMYLNVANGVDSIEWLKRVEDFGKIKVYEVSNPKDHFWTTASDLGLTYQYISPVEYKLDVKNANIGDKIIFSENYDASWIARDSNTRFYDWPNLISSNPYNRIFNSFTLRKAGDYSLIVFYYPQTVVNLGVIISISSLIFVISLLIFGSKLKKW